jgi:hypothetical protein
MPCITKPQMERYLRECPTELPKTDTAPHGFVNTELAHYPKSEVQTEIRGLAEAILTFTNRNAGCECFRLLAAL